MMDYHNTRTSKYFNENWMLLIYIPVLYLFIYNPILKPGISFGTIIIILSAVYSVFNMNSLKEYMHYYKSALLLSAFILVYVYSICSIKGTSNLDEIKTLLFWIIFSTVVPFFFVEVVFAKIRNIAFWDIIIEIGFIASIISCAALFSPSFNSFLRGIQLELDTREGLLDEQFQFRAFGFAYMLTSSYAYLQGLLASLCILRLDKHHKRYVFYIVFLVLSVIINARTGLIPILLTIAYLLISTGLKLKIGNIFKYVFICFVLSLVIIQFFSYFPAIGDFVGDFIDQVNLMLFQDEYKDSFYSEMLFFPDSTSGLLFGEGYSLFGKGHGKYGVSDIGYVNQIFIGGLVFAILLLMYELSIYRKIVKMSKERVFSTIFFVSMLVFNYKGVNYYSAVSFTKLWILYYFVLVHNQIKPLRAIKLS